jgi:hypothetical protein
LTNHPGYGENTSAAKWPDEAVGERLPWAFIFVIVLLDSWGLLRTLLLLFCSTFGGLLRLLLSECRSEQQSDKG